MSMDIEELLRDCIDQFTAGAKVPPGLVARVSQHHRRHRRAVRGGLAAGAAATGALAVAVAGVAGPSAVVAGPSGAARHSPAIPAGASRPAGPHVQTVADVIRRTDQAISTRNLIMETITNARVFSLEGPAGHQKAVMQHEIGWSYRNRDMGLIFTGPNTFDGPHHVTMAISVQMGSMRPGTMSSDTWTRVDYTNRTWARTRRREPAVPAPTTLSCSQRKFLSGQNALRADPSTSPSSIREAVSCGGLAITGHGRVDGMDTIKLSGTSRLTDRPLTVDVSPSTYLPVRMEFNGWRTDYRWLQPTQANLAHLTLRIPAGFRHSHITAVG